MHEEFPLLYRLRPIRVRFSRFRQISISTEEVTLGSASEKGAPARSDGFTPTSRHPLFASRASVMGHEDQFQPPRLSGGCRFGQAPFAKSMSVSEKRRKRTSPMPQRMPECLIGEAARSSSRYGSSYRSDLGLGVRLRVC